MATFGTLRIGLALLVAPLIAICRPCSCEECQMAEISKAIAAAVTGKKVTRATLHFDYNLFSLSDDGFSLTVTYTNPGRPLVTETVSGTYNKSGFPNRRARWRVLPTAASPGRTPVDRV
jgi:hypothetical protein